jgi:hypothetical protein
MLLSFILDNPYLSHNIINKVYCTSDWSLLGYSQKKIIHPDKIGMYCTCSHTVFPSLHKYFFSIVHSDTIMCALLLIITDTLKYIISLNFTIQYSITKFLSQVYVQRVLYVQLQCRYSTCTVSLSPPYEKLKASLSTYILYIAKNLLVKL